MSVLEEVNVLDNPLSCGHCVQLYGSDEKALARNVARFFGQGLQRGAATIAIAMQPVREAIVWEMRRQGVNMEAARLSKRFTMLEGEKTLASIVVDHYPDAERFDSVIGHAIEETFAQAQNNEVLAYGDMVGILWNDRQYPAAIRLEQLWNTLLKKTPITLFCGYPTDIFDATMEADIFDAIVSAHTHLLPSAEGGKLYSALCNAINDVVGDPANIVGAGNQHARSACVLPKGEAVVSWLRHHLPDKAGEILNRARAYYTELSAEVST